MPDAHTQKAIARQVKNLLEAMTLEEKIAQLGSCWIYDLQTAGLLDDAKLAGRLKNGLGQITRNAGAGSQPLQQAARTMNRIQRFLKEETRLGIPAIDHEECCSGLLAPGATIFPQMIGLASTFQPELAGRMTGMIRAQMRAAGAHQGLAPVLDVARDPRWGRVEETFGEDPTLAARFGAAYIRGLQGGDLRQGVMATGKHFAAHSFSQGGLNCAPVHLGWHDLWEVYLAPFQAAIQDAGLAGMMNAYPELDGEVVAASKRILTDLLRETLGFDGLLVSDYEAVQMIHTYHYAAENLSSAAAKALTAGIDVELPVSLCYASPLLEALEKGEVSLEAVDRSVGRHLQKKYELGLFENPYVDEGALALVLETAENRSLAYEIACKSLVLLKNDGLLPLGESTRRLAVIGPNAASSRCLMGDYSYAASARLMAAFPPEGSLYGRMSAEELDTPTVAIPPILEGIRAATPQGCQVDFSPGCDTLSSDCQGFEEARRLAGEADAVILVLGDISGLTTDCSTGEFRDAASLDLPGVQEYLALAVLESGKPVILVLVNGRPVSSPQVMQKAGAILEAWIPGEEGARAMADALFGRVNPGGRLPISVPRSAGHIPVFYNHTPSAMYSNIYGEYTSGPVTPLYPFGHGLSYTSFAYSGLEISNPQPAAGDTVDIRLAVTNRGERTGDEVVQLYTRDLYASLPRPVKELRGFVRLSLEPGEIRQVAFHLPIAQLAFYDRDLNLVVEAGKILVMVGSSSEDIRLSGEFTITGPGTIAIPKRVFVCPVSLA